MEVEMLRADLEEERAWRKEELAFYKNLLNSINKEEQKDRYRKGLVLVLYSHFEGYVKICLQSYVQFINDLKLPRERFVSGLVVAGMHKEFLAYENTDRKCEIFRRKLPDDTALHRYYRRVDFMDSFEEFKETLLSIEDDIIDTESNLWYIVLQKNLYKVGLPIDTFEQYKKDIDALVNRRNSIAHGSHQAGVTESEFEKWEVQVDKVLTDITIKIYDFASNKRFLK